ncbi:DNA-binding domain-containing protein [Luteolibacter arcticus]|uniref:DNA-binding domain-containing protein n=1 Tax=Luteolibacter arcticus TaxID=1581411 RepID=A0ABT3GGY5_9BACT|nr:DNA-binding domain-containing protein [Luteolibacter arcticus]MCW1922867.1 DNA-binding domain-containing protein [Luteolibacter arcticus]
MKPLEEVQREFFAALQMPLRGTSRRSTELPPNNEGHSPEFLAKAEELMKPGENLSSAERLELYHRQYWFRVLDSVADDFPVLRRMAGEEAFWSMLEAYLQAFPSESFTLRHLGRAVARFVSGWEGLDPVRRRWFAAVAELEYAAMETFESAERQPLPPERIASEALELQPHVRLIEMPVPADLCHTWKSFEPCEEVTTYVAVWRGAKGAHMQRLDPVEYVLLQRLKIGGRLDELFAEPVDPEPTPEEVQRWFAEWQSRGWITARGSEVIELVTQGDDWSGVDKMGSQARAMED